MPRFILGIAASILLLAGLSGSDAQAANAPLEEALAEMSIGSADAPVTLHEYASLTCSHCADFHTKTMPQIKKAYIDTGKVRLVFHDFPLGNLAMAGAMVARCSGKNNFFPMIGAMFTSQESWAHSDTPFEALVGIARLSGMSENDVDACLDNTALLAELQKRAKHANEVLGVQSTPTFFVEGKKIPGNMPFDDFKDVLDKALAK
ncbi:MAG: DsbA family protein [Rhodospirillaceae bacterium]|nr:DsbA family protein [Rhodospirillaceae bacterium]MBT5014087.1 DsbA family protein [Rhodospirillaceae bacterium]MBT5309841.1 DsbA family protein [Rhodospirillaceae bacterium]MBT7356738.1 DsbA family protein [Rhodospirillaceae bacterium]